MESEDDLISSCRSGSSEAWDALFDRYYSAAGRFIFQLSPRLSPEDTEEICQEVFLSVIRNINTFNGSSSFQTWLYRIAINKTRDFLARGSAAKRGGGTVPLSLDAEEPGTGLKLDPPAHAPGPDEALILSERMMLVHSALGQIGDPCREVIELRYFGDLSYEQISAELHLNPKTVSSRLSKCLDKLEAVVRRLADGKRMMTNAV